MGKFEINTDNIRKSVAELKTLRGTCEDYKKKSNEVNAENRGRVHNELERACEKLDDSWNVLIELIDRTIDFLSQTSEAHDTSDRKNAEAMKNTR